MMDDIVQRLENEAITVEHLSASDRTVALLRESAALIVEQGDWIAVLETKLEAAAQDTRRIDLIERRRLDVMSINADEWATEWQRGGVTVLGSIHPTARAAIDAVAKVLEPEATGGESPPEEENGDPPIGTTGRDLPPHMIMAPTPTSEELAAATNLRGRLERLLCGAIRSAVMAHGPITLMTAPSVAKRIVGELKSIVRQTIAKEGPEAAAVETAAFLDEFSGTPSEEELAKFRESLLEIDRLGREGEGPSEEDAVHGD